MIPVPESPAGTVLIVDDDQPVVAVLVRLLTREGYVVRTASDGESAMDSVEENPPDLCLLDVRLPGIDGFEVCRRIKQRAQTRLTPVVLVTGLEAREHRIAGINAGADDFLSKPFDAEELRARVSALIRLKHYTDELDSAESVILSLALTVEARDAYTRGHCEGWQDMPTSLASGSAWAPTNAGRCAWAATCTTSARSRSPTRFSSSPAISPLLNRPPSRNTR